MTPPIPLEEAQHRLLSGVTPLNMEEVATEAAAGRHLAAPLVARRTQPAADLSAMDGYAMRGDDLAGPWSVIGRSAAGRPFGGPLAPGQAVRIATGALLPADASAVLLQEEAARDGDSLTLLADGACSPRHIRRAGFDFAAGTPLLPAGTRIGAGQIALALSAGHATLPVGRLPRLAVLDSGDELARDPAACAPHQIPASNGAMLAAMAAPHAGAITRIGPVADTLEALAAALAGAEDADVLVTSGGASVGDHDLIRPALEAWGAQIAFWRVAIRPGKPLLVARRGPQWIIGLPGNPVSSYVTAVLFLLPLLRALAGAADPLPRSLHLPLAAPLPAAGTRTEFVRARLTDAGVLPASEQDSSALLSLAGSDALIRRPAGSVAARAGEMVAVHLLA
ncbi:molybdopterin molybdotransferase MoeA [Croceibacterium ferulae]|uniref:molybdopterin molybdotransferase MoeA n=1 Tax=Croceibacterium ferulae TaxID=1854641 RepID=UPI000EB14599|nr:molybdopterin molybdotransferase MoeA [Croceibacterium ferulae]